MLMHLKYNNHNKFINIRLQEAYMFFFLYMIMLIQMTMIMTFHINHIYKLIYYYYLIVSLLA